MPWFAFSKAFDWKPQPSVTVAYLPGQVKLVTTACAQAAAAKTCGSVVKKPASEKRHGEAKNSRRSS